METSGRNGLEITRNPDVSAPNGEGGLWLIDPNDITIVGGSVFFGISETSPFGPPTKDAQLGVDLISDALKLGNVLVTTGEDPASPPDKVGNIFWNAELNYTDTTDKNEYTLTLSAHNDIDFNESIFTTGIDQLNLNLIADSDGNGKGTVTVLANKSLMTNGGDIKIVANDLNLEGYLNSGTGDIWFIRTDVSNLTLSPDGSKNGNIGVKYITAKNLSLITKGNIIVKGLDQESTKGISNTVFLKSGGNVIFNVAASFFPGLKVYASNNIIVNKEIIGPITYFESGNKIHLKANFETTDPKGDFIAVADSDGDGSGDFTVESGMFITSARDIDVSAPKINADRSSFKETDQLILNGNVIGDGSVPPVTSGGGEPTLTNSDLEQAIEQAALATFLTEFFENGGPGGC